MLLPWVLLLSIEAFEFKRASKEDVIDWKLCGDKLGLFRSSVPKLFMFEK